VAMVLKDSTGEQLTIVCGDIVDSTVLEARVGDLDFRHALEKYFGRVHEFEVECNGGRVKTFGDGFLTTFRNPGNGLKFARLLQESLHRNPIVVGERQLAIRISVHAGVVHAIQTSYGEDLHGSDINLSARLATLAHPGEIALSEAAYLQLPSNQRTDLGESEQLEVKGHQIAVRRLNLAQV